MTYDFTNRSLDNMTGVNPDLVRLAIYAISISVQDFGVIAPAVRTLTEERHLVAIGASHTLKSHHLRQADGYGGAVDFVPYDHVSGLYKWDWSLIYSMARAFQKASAHMGIPVTWGGCWDRLLTEIGDPKMGSAAYVERQRALGNHHPFLDGVHIELGRN